ncbi:MAG: hypothetical protein WDW38_008710 [Sanguina aurantia]
MPLHVPVTSSGGLQAKQRATPVSISSLRVGQCTHISPPQIKHAAPAAKSVIPQRRTVSSVACNSTGGASDAVAALPWQAAMSEVKKRRDIKTIMIIGAGPIVIGQACEFDYSGTQAVKALRKEGYKVILINSNPATIMTDPGMADRTYVGPMTPELVEQILAKERPDAILPTMGGQTGLNLAKNLAETGVLAKYGIELIGAKLPSIDRAEDRELFKQAMYRIGLKCAPSGTASTVEEALLIAADIGKYPIIIRPAFTLGGTGGGIAYNIDELKEIVTGGLDASMTSQVLVEKSLLGWKEYEMEVMRDINDNVMIVCSIENVDPMGVHTGDSITVAPSQTLTDKELQRLRDASLAIIREMGVECGGSNVQMAINPDDGEMVIIEMNPRVSRSSALASKATGYPIAKMAAKLAVGYTLDQIANDITQKTPASFEPSIDYVVTKIPRFAFEKFPGSKAELTTMMKSVGEVMAMGRTWQESMQKAMRGMETGHDGWDLPNRYKTLPRDELMYKLRVPNPDRFIILHQVRTGMRRAMHRVMRRDRRWWLRGLEIGKTGLNPTGLDITTADGLAVLKRELPASAKGATRRSHASTAYMYSTYEEECEAAPTDRDKIMVLGGGPNRIGQGIEFDYCCVHASLALREDGYETIMVNCNPETVSTDYDTSDRLYFESLTLEDVLEIVHVEKPKGVIVQYGGQTPLKLARALEAAGVPIIGTSPTAMRTSRGGCDVSFVKESGVGGGSQELYVTFAVEVDTERPVLVDKYLDRAIEMDVDALCDKDGNVTICAIAEHIEQAGIHSGDSACSIPTQTVPESVLKTIREWTVSIAQELKVLGLINIQFAVQDDVPYIIEANPRASRTVPFVAKAVGHPIAKYASLLMAGKTLKEIGFTEEPIPTKHVAVKEVVLPFNKFPGADTLLGPEMRSTGEVMGIDATFAGAYAKAAIAAGQKLPSTGKVFITMTDKYKKDIVEVARDLGNLGFGLVATGGTAATLRAAGIPCELVYKISEGRPNPVDFMKNHEIVLMMMTSGGDAADLRDGKALRRLALTMNIPTVTTLAGAKATAAALRAMRSGPLEQICLQEFFPDYKDVSDYLMLGNTQ